MAASDQEMLTLVTDVEAAIRAHDAAKARAEADVGMLKTQYAESDRIREELNAAERGLMNARLALDAAIQERAAGA